MDDAEHEDILTRATRRFPYESFDLMRRAGLGADEALTMLGFSRADLSYAEQAVVNLEPWDSDQAMHLLAPRQPES